jgi:hypothetical protein
VISTQSPKNPALMEFNKMKQEEPWATILKNTGYFIMHTIFQV